MLCLALCALALLCAAPAVAASDPAGAAGAYIHQKLPNCHVQIHDTSKHGTWAAISADCRGHEGDSVMNLYAHKTGRTWTVVCGHGDDDGGPGFAKTCGMPPAIAKAFGY
ncbi:MAG: hypothetical protein NVSMB31_19080 [Vulcanimicrobiaceae bacterium]